jgi:hypothetical protein
VKNEGRKDGDEKEGKKEKECNAKTAIIQRKCLIKKKIYPEV